MKKFIFLAFSLMALFAGPEIKAQQITLNVIYYGGTSYDTTSGTPMAFNTDYILSPISVYHGNKATFTFKENGTNAGRRLVRVTQSVQAISDSTARAYYLESPTFTGTVTIPTPFTLGAVSVLPTGTELNYVDGVTSAIQTQLNTKAPAASPTFTGVPTIPTPFTLGAVSVTATGTEMNYLSGVSGAIQTQFSGKLTIDTGRVTQATKLTQGVTLNASTGLITTVSTTLPAGSDSSIIVTNNKVLTSSTIQLTAEYAGTGKPTCWVKSFANGSFTLQVGNWSNSAALNNKLRIHYYVINK